MLLKRRRRAKFNDRGPLEQGHEDHWPGTYDAASTRHSPYSENRWLEREPIAEAGVTPPPATYLTLPRQDDLLRGRLIRFRKAVPSTVPYATQARWHEEVISTLFPAANLVEQILVTVPRHLREHADKMMARDTLAKIRAPHRRGVDTAKDEPHALLVTDMTPREGSGDVLIEFKPKWLAQSPSAPAGARRCRTCALRAQRNAGRRAEGQEELVSFCPLDLVSREPARIALAAEIILDGVKNLSGRRRDEVFPRFCDFLLNHDLLHRLRRLQLELDPLGVFAADVSSQSFLTATTLRDCSLYVRVSPARDIAMVAVPKWLTPWW